MRIQHNIMAMSAYRNYTNNVAAMKKNLEKLSSGYKINRAGDDAAGLAISEKMRAQITGLETAQKNAKDGISLVQTAEGALTEVHDMLNRMVELATMSANGTYDNTTDRAQLQKEMDQLNSEINRIADSANFNGIKLLDGSMATTTSVADPLGVGMKDMASAITHIADGVAADSPAVKTKFELDLSQVSVTNKGTQLGNITQATATGATIADSNDDTVKTSITYDFADAAIAKPAAGGSTVKLTIGDQELELDVGEDALADTDIAEKVRDALAGKTVKIGGVDFTVATTTDATVKLEAVTAADDSTAVGADGALTGADITLAAGKPVQETMKIEINLGDAAGGNSVVLNGGSDIEIEFGKTWTGKDIAAKFMENLAGKEVEIDGTKFKVSNDNGKLTFVMSEDPTAKFEANLTADLAVKDSAGTVIAEAGGLAGSANKNDKGAVINQGEGIGVHIIDNAKAAETRHMAQGSLDLSQLNNGRGIEDGTALKIGDETYIFAVGKDSKYKDMQNVVDLTHVDTTDTANWSAANIAKEASRRLSAVAMGNKMFDVSTDNVNGTVRLTERLNSGIDYTVNNLEGPTADVLNELTTDVAKKNAAWKDLVQAGTANLDAKPAVTSGGLMLQIGDTAEDFNQLRVSINDCHVAALGLDKIKISDQDSAAQAVDAIKDAINYVSDVRGTLGATQNRLDHTINNLSVMTENIQDAESTIRDVDVAEEMMAYTKNNILIQSAQAMLAQANQVPQGVLQLLQ